MTNHTNDPNNKTPESQESNKVREFLTPSFKVKDRYQEIKQQQGRKPIKRWLKVVTLFLILLTVIILFVSNYTNKAVQRLDEARDVQLDLYESTKLAVLDDISAYLSIQTKEDYTSIKATMNVTEDFRNEIFGNTFDATNFYGATNVKGVDVQYSLEDGKGLTKYYLMLNVTKGDVTKQIEMLVFVHSNQIIDILII